MGIFFRKNKKIDDKVDSFDEHFKQPGDLDVDDKEVDYFRPASDLEVDNKGNDYFRPAGDLTSDSIPGSDYFKQAGDLDDKKDDGYFRHAGDLEVNNKGTSYLRSAGDLDDSNNVNLSKKNVTIEEVKEYLLTVVSGKKFDYECELGTLCGGGQTMVSFSDLKQMVENGYNIVKADCINPDMIMVEFQQYKKDKTNSFGR